MSGCLAGFVTQCSISPPNFLVCISKVNHTLVVAQHSSGMGLHLLGADQVDLARLFGEETGGPG
jgi:flavin reductase (DIM6/NTAB) family NADH-FMN oxidoreductase RutF